MVLLLNFLYLIITFAVLVGAWLLRKTPKKVAILGVVWLLFMITLMAVTPAIPKYAPSKFEPVIFEPSETAEIRDSLRKPEFTEAEQRERAEKLFDWRSKGVQSQDIDKAKVELKQVDAEKVD